MNKVSMPTLSCMTWHFIFVKSLFVTNRVLHKMNIFECINLKIFDRYVNLSEERIDKSLGVSLCKQNRRMSQKDQLVNPNYYRFLECKVVTVTWKAFSDEQKHRRYFLPTVSHPTEGGEPGVPQEDGQEAVSEVLLWPLWRGIPEKIHSPPSHDRISWKQCQELQKMWTEKLLLFASKFLF